MNCVTSLAFFFLFLFNNKNGLIFLDGMERKEDGVSKIEFHVSGALMTIYSKCKCVMMVYL